MNTYSLPEHLLDEKPTENITGCRLCGDTSEAAIDSAERYGSIVPGADVCFSCATRVINAFEMAHSGRWKTYPNPPPAPPTKEKILQKLRKSVLERDGYRCKHCDTHYDLCIDHIKPESKGGETVLDNLQTLCRSCNSKKGTKA